MGWLGQFVGSYRSPSRPQHGPLSRHVSRAKRRWGQHVLAKPRVDRGYHHAPRSGFRGDCQGDRSRRDGSPQEQRLGVDLSLKAVAQICAAWRRLLITCAISSNGALTVVRDGRLALAGSEDVVDRRARRKRAPRHIPPRAARAQKIEDRIHRCAHIGLAWPPARLRRRDQRLQTLPLRVSQIAGKGRPRLFVGRPLRLRPHPESNPPSHLGGSESRPAPPRQKLLGQALSVG
jgi:hypothetical protein